MIGRPCGIWARLALEPGYGVIVWKPAGGYSLGWPKKAGLARGSAVLDSRGRNSEANGDGRAPLGLSGLVLEVERDMGRSIGTGGRGIVSAMLGKGTCCAGCSTCPAATPAQVGPVRAAVEGRLKTPRWKMEATPARD